MKKIKVTLYNSFHNTSVNIMIDNDNEGTPLTENQIKRARRELCGQRKCACSNELGYRGKQDVAIEQVYWGGEGPGFIVYKDKSAYLDKCYS